MTSRSFTVGSTIFVIGLFKKVVIADHLGSYSDKLFAFTDAGNNVSTMEAWMAMLAYTFQLYFDFSGYSDMAIGLARMFGLVLPLNFFSPYKSFSPAEFWRRWHISLSRFFREYLYIPLGGNRHGQIRQYANLMTTMALCGLWHGASWTFALWGFLHGILLVVNHSWHRHAKGLKTFLLYRILGWVFTFGTVTLLWVLFRARSFGGAVRMYRAIFGMDGIGMPVRYAGSIPSFGGLLRFDGVIPHQIIESFPSLMFWLCCAAALAFLAPNTAQIMHRYRPALAIPVTRQNLRSFISYRANALWGTLTAILFMVALHFISVVGNIEFVYRFF
jgi:hypothetical protein